MLSSIKSEPIKVRKLREQIRDLCLKEQTYIRAVQRDKSLNDSPVHLPSRDLACTEVLDIRLYRALALRQGAYMYRMYMRLIQKQGAWLIDGTRPSLTMVDKQAINLIHYAEISSTPVSAIWIQGGHVMVASYGSRYQYYQFTPSVTSPSRPNVCRSHLPGGQIVAAAGESGGRRRV